MINLLDNLLSVLFVLRTLYRDVQAHKKELEFFFKEFPLTTKFEEITYNSNLQKSFFKNLVILNDINKEFKIDISFLQGLYLDSRISEISPKIRMSLFFLMTNKERQINVQTENTEYSCTDTKSLGNRRTRGSTEACRRG